MTPSGAIENAFIGKLGISSPHNRSDDIDGEEDDGLPVSEIGLIPPPPMFSSEDGEDHPDNVDDDDEDDEESQPDFVKTTGICILGNDMMEPNSGETDKRTNFISLLRFPFFNTDPSEDEGEEFYDDFDIESTNDTRIIQTVPAKEPKLDAVPLKSALKKSAVVGGRQHQHNHDQELVMQNKHFAEGGVRFQQAPAGPQESSTGVTVTAAPPPQPPPQQSSR